MDADAPELELSVVAVVAAQYLHCTFIVIIFLV